MEAHQADPTDDGARRASRSVEDLIALGQSVAGSARVALEDADVRKHLAAAAGSLAAALEAAAVILAEEEE